MRGASGPHLYEAKTITQYYYFLGQKLFFSIQKHTATELYCINLDSLDG